MSSTKSLVIAIFSLSALFTPSLHGMEIVDSTHVLKEVVVTGSNVAVGKNLLPYTVSTVSGKQLEATGNTQLLGAVSGIVPSLFVSERNIFGFGVSNGGSGHIKLRGVGGDRASAVLMDSLSSLVSIHIRLRIFMKPNMLTELKFYEVRHLSYMGLMLWQAL